MRLFRHYCPLNLARNKMYKTEAVVLHVELVVEMHIFLVLFCTFLTVIIKPLVAFLTHLQSDLMLTINNKWHEQTCAPLMENV